MTLPTLALVLACGQATAHDYWLEPRPAADGATDLRLFVGECLEADEEKRYEPSRTTRLEAWGAGASADLRPDAREGAQPLLNLPPNDAQRLIVFERNASYLVLAPKKFDDYLREEGLEAVRVERRKTAAQDKPGRERYLRFLKTLTPGKADIDIATRIVGQRLELVPLQDPTELNPGEQLHVRLLLEGQPLPGAKIDYCTRNADGKIAAWSEISDRSGGVAFTLPGTGLALIRTVHMHRVADADPKADWESLWTSYSFIARGR